MKYFVLLVLFCCMALLGKAQSNDTSTIILVRHAEKSMEGGKNPHLSEAGRTRAEKLAYLFKNVAIDALYIVRNRRTWETLAPLAKVKRLGLKEYDMDNPQTIYNMIAYGQGKTIVIAGDFDTVPTLVNVLMHRGVYSPIPEDEYGNIWVLKLHGYEVINCSLYNY